VRKVQVPEVECRLDDVHEGLSVRESVSASVGLQAVDEVYVLVYRVWAPDPVQVTSVKAPGSARKPLRLVEPNDLRTLTA
jgi:hypothetical protein